MSRSISWVRPFGPRRSRLMRSGEEPGSIEYSAVTHPLPLPRIQRGTSSSTIAVHSTRVRPKDTITEPSAKSVKSRSKVIGRSSSGSRPSALMAGTLPPTSGTMDRSAGCRDRSVAGPGLPTPMTDLFPAPDTPRRHRTRPTIRRVRRARRDRRRRRRRVDSAIVLARWSSSGGVAVGGYLRGRRPAPRASAARRAPVDDREPTPSVPDGLIGVDLDRGRRARRRRSTTGCSWWATR